MKIKTSSWHYRFLNWAEFPIPRSICTYFWAVVFMFIMGWWIWLLFNGIVKLIDAVSDRELGPFSQWIKSKKDMVCPIIEIDHEGHTDEPTQ